ncbi:MAG: capsular biosynthesis protein [Bacteroidales bacterium]|nr:capsular biosynthesis protein [Bacteroidales bacterium]
MWFFTSRQTIKNSGLMVNSLDCHSHILPGVDDGVQTMDEALEILANFEEQGVAEVWLTPHVMEDIPNTTNFLKECFARLQAEYRGNVKLNLAAEYMLDALFDERLAENDILPLGKRGNNILVETSYFNPPMGLQCTLARIKSKGYYPILAHPERYQYMNKEDYTRLKASGIKFQLNWASLAGKYGRSEQKKAEWLVKKNMYDIVGSDTHRLSMRYWNMKINASIARKIKESPMLGKYRGWGL